MGLGYVTDLIDYFKDFLSNFDGWLIGSNGIVPPVIISLLTFLISVFVAFGVVKLIVSLIKAVI